MYILYLIVVKYSNPCNIINEKFTVIPVPMVSDSIFRFTQENG